MRTLPSLVPLAGAVHRLLEVVVHHGGIAGAVEGHGAGLQSVLAAAFAEACVAVDVKVEYSGRRAFPIAGVDGDLRGEKNGEVPGPVKVLNHLSFPYRRVAPAVVFPDGRPNSHSFARLAVLLTCPTFAH